MCAGRVGGWGHRQAKDRGPWRRRRRWRQREKQGQEKEEEDKGKVHWGLCGYWLCSI